MTDEAPHSQETVARMVRALEPTWRVHRIDAEPEGLHAVYRLDLETLDGTRECVLKVGTDESDDAVRTESRLLRALHSTTSIPVPDVLGVVDEHADLPAPFFLMESLPGESVSRTEMDRLPESTIRRIARESGRHLAALHGPDAVDGYGQVVSDPPEPLRGGLPPAGFDHLRVAEPADSWPAYVRESVDGVLDHLSTGRFADVVPAIREAIDDRLDALAGPHRPALGHVDCSLENLLVEPDSGTVRAVLDWEFTLAVTPAYDLGFVVHSLSGGPWRYVPSAQDHGQVVREALLAGYREAGSAAAANWSRTEAVDRYREARGLYDLLPTVHSMVNFEDWLSSQNATDEQVDGAARAHRATVEALL